MSGAALASLRMKASRNVSLHNRGSSLNLDVGTHRKSFHTRHSSVDFKRGHKRRSSLDIMRATPSFAHHGVSKQSSPSMGGGGSAKRGSFGGSEGKHVRRSSLELLGAKQFQSSNPMAQRSHNRMSSWDSLLLRTGSIRGSSLDVLRAKQSSNAGFDDKEALAHAIQGDTITAYIDQATRARKFDDNADNDDSGPTGDVALHKPQKGRLARTGSMRFARLTGVMNTIASDDEAELAGPLNGYCILIPGSELRQGWDITMIFCLLYTAIFTPFQIAFLQEYSLSELTDCTMSPADCTAWVFFFITDRICDTLFVIDIMVNFRSAWRNEDVITGRISLEYDCKRASIAYAKSWLVLDIISVLPFDIMELFLPAGGDISAGLLRIPKLIRLVRLMKLLKVVRASRILKRWEQSLILKVPYGAVRLLQFLFFTLFVIHWLGCGYFIVASYADDVFTWVNNAPAAIARSRGDMYILSIYWAIETVTTVGYGDVGPVSTSEKLYVIIAMAMGVAVFSYVLGTMCTLLAGFKTGETAFQARMDTMLTFLNAHEDKIPDTLRRKALDYCFYARDSANSVFNESDVKNANDLLSEDMQKQVRHS